MRNFYLNNNNIRKNKSKEKQICFDETLGNKILNLVE